MAFDFLDRTQLEAFDAQCIQYGKYHHLLVQDCPALRLLYDFGKTSGVSDVELSRRIALALEIKLGFIHTHYDLSGLAGMENKYLVPDIARMNYRPYENLQSFSIALRRSRSAFSLIARIRSVWDKTFLWVAMVTEGADLVRRLQGQRSKRRFFFTHFAAGFDDVTPEMVALASDALTKFEQDFRTPELHGFGNIRGWAFDSPSDWLSQHSSDLMGHWAVLSEFLFAVFAKSSTQWSSFD
ncbi:MAG: hypothetical protein H8K06_16020 [Nitrospira sp.]|nr:hypothetical protein [Nitrospira sp.]